MRRGAKPTVFRLSWKDAKDVVSISLWEQDGHCTALSVVLDVNGDYVEDSDEVLHGECPFTVLRDAMLSMRCVVARNCAIFINSPTIHGWIFDDRMQIKGEDGDHPKWEILRQLFFYRSSNVWDSKGEKQHCLCKMDEAKAEHTAWRKQNVQRRPKDGS